MKALRSAALSLASSGVLAVFTSSIEKGARRCVQTTFVVNESTAWTGGRSPAMRCAIAA
jgi:hypothetical protein